MSAETSVPLILPSSFQQQKHRTFPSVNDTIVFPGVRKHRVWCLRLRRSFLFLPGDWMAFSRTSTQTLSVPELSLTLSRAAFSFFDPDKEHRASSGPSIRSVNRLKQQDYLSSPWHPWPPLRSSPSGPPLLIWFTQHAAVRLRL